MSLFSASIFGLGSDVRAQATAIVDTNGNQLSGFDSSRPATSTITTVPSSATSVTLLAANPARRQIVINNVSSKNLYVAFAATATTAAYTFLVPSMGTFVGPLNSYTGQVTGIWSTANGNAVITEITT